MNSSIDMKILGDIFFIIQKEAKMGFSYGFQGSKVLLMVTIVKCNE